MKENKGIKILILSLTFSGLLSTTTGVVLNNMKTKTVSNKMAVKVIEKKVARIKSNVPVLKDMTVEINEPISVDVKDYIKNIDDISTNVLREFKLDTSLVNVTQAGKYSYIIEYKDKKYVGSVIVKDKENPADNLHLKKISFKLNSTLPTNVSEYIEEKLSEEDLKKAVLDISKVNTKLAGDYQFTITYDKLLYTGTITIYEEKPSKKLNKINYTVKHMCGTELIDKVSKSETSTTKAISVNLTDITKKNNLGNCSSEIDTAKTKYSTSIEVHDEDIIYIYYKSLTTEKEDPQTESPKTNE